MKLKIQMTILGCMLTLAGAATSMEKLKSAATSVKRAVTGNLTTAKDAKSKEEIAAIKCKPEDLTDKIQKSKFCPEKLEPELKTGTLKGGTMKTKFTYGNKTYVAGEENLKALQDWMYSSTARKVGDIGRTAGKIAGTIATTPITAFGGDDDDNESSGKFQEQYTLYQFVSEGKNGEFCRYRMSKAHTSPERGCITFNKQG